jgi:hypothetical protein
MPGASDGSRYPNDHLDASGIFGLPYASKYPIPLDACSPVVETFAFLRFYVIANNLDAERPLKPTACQARGQQLGSIQSRC